MRWPAWTVLTLATSLQVLAYELAYWFAHYCFHKVPALGEFHKVHHSAEVMTGLTELRQHPVEWRFCSGFQGTERVAWLKRGRQKPEKWPSSKRAQKGNPAGHRQVLQGADGRCEKGGLTCPPIWLSRRPWPPRCALPA
jgi:hypothetical protein